MFCKRFCGFAFFYRKTRTLADILPLTLPDTKAFTMLKTTFILFRVCPGFQNPFPLHNWRSFVGGP